jgi:hypothetical protein
MPVIDRDEEAGMAVGMLLAGEGVTEESYRQLTEEMFGSYPMREDQAPDGCLVHTAGQGEQGWYIYDIWSRKNTSSALWTRSSGRRWSQLAPPPTARRRSLSPSKSRRWSRAVFSQAPPYRDRGRGELAERYPGKKRCTQGGCAATRRWLARKRLVNPRRLVEPAGETTPRIVL